VTVKTSTWKIIIFMDPLQAQPFQQLIHVSYYAGFYVCSYKTIGLFMKRKRKTTIGQKQMFSQYIIQNQQICQFWDKDSLIKINILYSTLIRYDSTCPTSLLPPTQREYWSRYMFMNQQALLHPQAGCGHHHPGSDTMFM
jgi:hypothetical protein